MKNNKKKCWILAGIIICVLVIFGTIIIVKNNVKSSNETYAVNYTVKADSASAGIVSVTMEVIPEKIKAETELFFQIPEINTSEPKCVTKS